jgi:hypothetical protein
MSFPRTGTSTAAAAKPRPVAGARPTANTKPVATPGRYAGLRGAKPRYPLLSEFDGVLQCIKTYETANPRTGRWFHADFNVVSGGNETHKDGSQVTILQCVSENAIAVGGPIMISIIVALSGYESDDEFFDEHGGDGEGSEASRIIDAACGVKGLALDDGKELGENPFEGDKVCVNSYPSKLADNGTQYYGQTWSSYVES